MRRDPQHGSNMEETNWKPFLPSEKIGSSRSKLLTNLEHLLAHVKNEKMGGTCSEAAVWALFFFFSSLSDEEGVCLSGPGSTTVAEAELLKAGETLMRAIYSVEGTAGVRKRANSDEQMLNQSKGRMLWVWSSAGQPGVPLDYLVHGTEAESWTTGNQFEWKSARCFFFFLNHQKHLMYYFSRNCSFQNWGIRKYSGSRPVSFYILG